MTQYYRGDDTNAFGQNMLRINRPADLPEYFTISKIIFQCGPLQKTFYQPQFPIYVNFNHNETQRLRQTNECYLQVFDDKGLRQTCGGTLTLTTIPGVIKNESGQQRRRSNL